MKILKFLPIPPTKKQLESRTEYELAVQRLSEHPILNKVSEFNAENISREIEKFLQIHILRCKLCNKRGKKVVYSCGKVDELVNLLDVL